MLKITKQLFFQLLVAMTLASVSLNQQCSQNCYSCFAKAGKGYCGLCYERKGLKNAESNEICSSDPQPASDICLVYGGPNCVYYKPGWAANFDQDGPLYFKGTIQNCVREYVENRQHRCTSCLGGYPSQDKARCIPSSQIKNPIPRCVVGQSLGQGSHYCARCEPGYTFNASQCVKTPPSLEGSLSSFEGKCMFCDNKNGYYMKTPASCGRRGSA